MLKPNKPQDALFVIYTVNQSSSVLNDNATMTKVCIFEQTKSQDEIFDIFAKILKRRKRNVYQKEKVMNH